MASAESRIGRRHSDQPERRGAASAGNEGVKLVAGVLDIRERYLNLDAGNVYTASGNARNRRLKASPLGVGVAHALDIALGGVLLDRAVMGEAVILHAPAAARQPLR